MFPCENLCQVVEKSVAYGRKKANLVIQEFGSYLMRKNKFLVQKLMLKLLEHPNEDQVTILRTKF